MGVASKVLILVTFFIVLVKAGVLPVEKCKLEDSTCMMAAWQKALPIFLSGLPEANIDNMDPLMLDDIGFEISGFQFTLKDAVLKGLKSTVIDNVKWNSKKKRIEVVYHLNALIRGNYKAGGRLLILPISGDGQMKLKLKNISVHLYIDYKLEKGADGKDHVVPYKYDITFDVKDNAHYTLTNLFNGNKQLSDAMLTFLNQNWKQVTMEFGGPFMEATAKNMFQNLIKFFAKDALEDIAEV